VMARLPAVSSDGVIRALYRAGFTDAPKRGKGSHVALYKKDEVGKTHLVVVPKRKTLPKGTLLAILDQAGLTRAEFMKLL